MPSYMGKHAEYYDIFYADKPYAEEAQFVDDCLQRFASGPNQSLLELACGTGKHALEMAQRGYQVLALDYSKDLLEVARRRAAESGANIDFRLADMRELDLEVEPFDAAICLFDSIGYVRTNEALKATLDGIHRHIRPGGVFVFEFWHAAAMLREYESRRERVWQTGEGELRRISTTELDVKRQLATVIYDIYDSAIQGEAGHLQETQINRYFLVQEMDYFLSSSGFESLAFFAGYSLNEAISEKTWHVLTAARRK